MISTPADVHKIMLEFLLKCLQEKPAECSPKDARMLLRQASRVMTQLNRIAAPPKPRKRRAKR